MFNFTIGVLNAVGWIAGYIFSGGWASETSSLHLTTILIILTGSFVGTIGSYLWRSSSDNPIINIWRILEFSTFLSAPFINLFYGDAPLFNKIIGFIVCGFTYLVNVYGKFSSQKFVIKWGCMIFYLFVNIPFLGNSFGKEILGMGFAIALPLSIVLGIKNTYFD